MTHPLISRRLILGAGAVALTAAGIARSGARAQDSATTLNGTPAASPMAGDHATDMGMSGSGAAYMTITNAGAEPDQLIGGATDVARVVEIHEIVDNAGVMEMRPLADGVEIPAGGEVVLEPGGYHVMLIGLTESLRSGMTFDLILNFATMGEVVVPIIVQVQAPTEDEPTTVTSGDLTITGSFARPAPMIQVPATPAATPAS